MKSGKKLRSIGRLTILLLTLTSLSACSFLTPTIRVKLATDCTWFESQKFSEETKAWLTREPWPDYVKQDLDKIADNNDLAERFCEK